MGDRTLFLDVARDDGTGAKEGTPGPGLGLKPGLRLKGLYRAVRSVWGTYGSARIAGGRPPYGLYWGPLAPPENTPAARGPP